MRQRDAGDVYRELAPAVRGYLRTQGVDDVDDVLGEVFLSVARDLGRFDGDEAALRRWVFTIAHNRIQDAVRKRSRRPVVADRELPDLPAPPPVDAVDPTVVVALGRLTSEQREVIVLRFVADLAVEDVARITRRRVGAVKAMQRRALDRLRSELNAPNPAPSADPAPPVPEDLP